MQRVLVSRTTSAARTQVSSPAAFAARRSFRVASGPAAGAARPASPGATQLRLRTYATDSSSSSSSGGSSNTLLYAALGVGAAGAAYWLLAGSGDDDPTKPKAAASPKQVDYQKVYDAIAARLEDENYDGQSLLTRSGVMPSVT